jgi:hypothetical protein
MPLYEDGQRHAYFLKRSIVLRLANNRRDAIGNIGEQRGAGSGDQKREDDRHGEAPDASGGSHFHQY